jgi:putative flavoprotein involved in K+ transport
LTRYDGQPMHYRGVVDSEPGLCFLGLVFQYALSSDVLPGGGRDAEHIAKHIASRRPRGSAAEKRQVLAGA